jgi:POT family proton-dependent oligopeptide transporter
MFKGHPKGLYVLFFSNMGERFGYYTMMAIFTLYLEAKLGWSVDNLGIVWGGFLFCVYGLPLIGGIWADKAGYGKVVKYGIYTMFAGYALLALPGMGTWVLFASLIIIALGTGLFKGNLAVILGNLYESKGLKPLHDAAFNIFYMGINVGAFIAPHAATGIRNWLMTKQGYTYDSSIPGMAHQFLNGTLESTQEYMVLAQEQVGDAAVNLSSFSQEYVDVLSQSYNAGFGLAAISMIMSLIIFIAFKKYYKHADYLQSKKIATGEAQEMPKKESRDRVVALLLIFLVVVFFWMAFHQNGYTFTMFAKNYTVDSVGKFTFILFDLPALLSVIGAIVGLVFLIGKNNTAKLKTIGLGMLVLGGFLAYSRIGSFENSGNPITAELFQSFNPIFVVFLTPIIVGFFAFLNKRNKEPSTPRKIGAGMLIMAAGLCVMIFASLGLSSPSELEGIGGHAPASQLVTPYWLIGTYFSLTIAELFISPMGLAFVSKVSPPKFRGMMQGGWLFATAIGNLLSGLIGKFYANWEVWQFILMLVITSLISAMFMFSILKRLERVTK